MPDKPNKFPAETDIKIKIFPEINKKIWGYKVDIHTINKQDVRLVYTGFNSQEEVLIRVCERLLCYFLGKEVKRGEG